MRMHAYPSVERLTLMRNGYLSAGAVCLAIVIALTQVNSRGIAFYMAAISGSIAMPVMFAIASIYESYILLGVRSYPFLRSRSVILTIGNLVVLGTIATLVCIGSLLWMLSPYATGSFVCAAITVKVVIRRFVARFSEWWYDEKGPGYDEPDLFERMHSSSKNVTENT